MTLDTLAQVLEIECCWVQTINAKKRSLHLAAERGFDSEMQREMSTMDMSHHLSEQVVGLGNEIVIPDLSNNGQYGLSSFQAAGYKWLVAVPLMTYRVHGVLGIASRNKKRLRKETADLVMVIAGLIGTALNKAGLSRELPAPEKAEKPAIEESHKEPVTPRKEPPILTHKTSAPHVPPEKHALKPADSTFNKHAYKMKSFRRLHH
jgi:transcriptional regulator with GAF, ATPase, and Fis domain